MNEMEDLFGEARSVADVLYQLRDTYFPANPADKVSELQRKSDLALALLDSLPLEQRRLPIQRATFEFLRGKILDVFPEYRKEAEDHLSKAVKLNPSLADAWLCLGNYIWKKGDLANLLSTLALIIKLPLPCTSSLYSFAHREGSGGSLRSFFPALKEGDQLTLLEPYYRSVDVSWKEKCYQFKSIRVDFIEQVLLNGKPLASHQVVRTSIYAQHKP